MIEQWKPIPGYEGLYEVSDQGRVKSLPRRYSPGVTYLSPTTARDTFYYSYSLCKDSSTKLFRAHELVMFAFSPKPSNEDLEIRHINGDPLDNRFSNLEWGTPAQNKEDRKVHGTWGWKLRRRDVEAIYAMRMLGVTLSSIAQRFGTSPQTISQIYNGKTWQHVYADYFNNYDTY